MEKKDSALRIVLLVFGIIFSVILVPGLIIGIPVGGVMVGLSQSVSQEGIEAMIEEAKLSENVYQLVMDEAKKGLQEQEDLQGAFWGELVEECITLETVDGMITELVDSMYNGTDPQLDLSSVKEGFRTGIAELKENGFDDIYSACFEGTESRYFSAEFVQSVKKEVEDKLLSEYSGFGVTTFEELETAYNAQFGDGAFDKIVDEKMAEFEQSWNDEFINELDGEMDSVMEEVELEVNESLRETVQDPDVRMVFDMLREISTERDKIKAVAYGIVVAAVVLLLVCYWFGTAGFVVPAVALLLGGLLCKLLTLFEAPFISLVKEELAIEPGMEEVADVVLDLCRGIVAPFFAEVSKFGVTMMGIAVLLILAAILRGVVKKNMHISEETM